jgi:hypothetical protein
MRQAPTRFGGQGRQSHSTLISVRRLSAGLACALFFILVIAVAVPGTAKAAFKVCNNQTYALCAVASCFVLNGVSYCKCDVKNGDSISLPFNYAGGNVCTINARGVGNGYMLSTYSVPPSARPGGNKAIYTCPATTSDGAYAQCDGGTCFSSTRGQPFPGFAQPLRANEIICSCPITTANPSSSFVGHQIAGPYPCQASFFANCQSAKAHTRTGGTIYVGAPTGTTALLSKELTGSVPNFNQCPAPGVPGVGFD